MIILAWFTGLMVWSMVGRIFAVSTTKDEFWALEVGKSPNWSRRRLPVVEAGVLEDYLRRLLDALRATPGAINCFSVAAMLKDLGMDEGRANQMWLGGELRARGWARRKVWLESTGPRNRWFPPIIPLDDRS